MGIRESAHAHVESPAVGVFRLLTDVSRLPEWNRAITNIVESPDRREPVVRGLDVGGRARRRWLDGERYRRVAAPHLLA